MEFDLPESLTRLLAYGPAVSDWLNKWQTLITGILALVGAWWTVSAVREQIRQADQSEERRRQNESYAARAVLPLTLSSICDYAEQCIKMLAASSPDDSGKHLVGPAISSSLIDPLRECIRFSDRKQAKAIADLLSWLQIQQSRLRGLSSEEAVTSHEIDSAILDAAKLYVLAENLFPYGRHSEGKVYVQASDLSRALRIVGIYEEEHESVFQLLGIRGPKQ